MGRHTGEANDGSAMTHQQIADRLGMSREGVLKIEQRALEKLRRAIEDGDDECARGGSSTPRR